MYPFLKDGDRLVVRKLTRPSAKLIGKIVVARDPRDNGVIMIKRLVDMSEDRFTLFGDNVVASTDSRTLGSFPNATILGVAIYRYHPLSSAGRLRRRMTSY